MESTKDKNLTSERLFIANILMYVFQTLRRMFTTLCVRACNSELHTLPPVPLAPALSCLSCPLCSFGGCVQMGPPLAG